MKNPTKRERRKIERRNISFYLSIYDNATGKVIGHLVNISPIGLLLDAQAPITVDQKYDLHLEFMEDVEGRASLDITTICKWCKNDPVQPFVFNAGFEIQALGPGDQEVINAIAEKYGG